MRKQEFLEQLRARLVGFPVRDVEDRIAFYSEMIDDRIEEGMSEKDAIAAVGALDSIVLQIISDIPLTRIAREKIKPKRRLQTWEILLLVIGSPIWVSLAIATFAVILALYAVLWSLIVSIWAVFVSLIACALGGTVAGIVFAATGNGLTGAGVIAAAVVCAGLAIFMFFGCKAATKGTLLLAKGIILGIKKCFIGKETV